MSEDRTRIVHLGYQNSWCSSQESPTAFAYILQTPSTCFWSSLYYYNTYYNGWKCCKNNCYTDFFRESLLGRKTGHVHQYRCLFPINVFYLSLIKLENVEAVEIKNHVCITSRSLYNSSHPELQLTLDFGTPSLA